jgi:molybdenum cofactor synthesis domain-containing protein
MPKTAGIILIGNEILSGKISDANAAWLCHELRALGVDVRRVSVIPDEVALIAEEVAALSRRYDVVFTSGGVGPTHDDVTIEGAARGLGMAVVQHPALVALLRRHLGAGVTPAHLKMAEVPDGAELVDDDSLGFPTIVAGNVYILPGVPEIFRQKFETIRERFREPPYHVKSVFVRIGEGTLAAHLNALLHEYPALLLGSYPELANPEYRVKVTLESKDAAYLEDALAAFLARLPGDAVVKVT